MSLGSPGVGGVLAFGYGSPNSEFGLYSICCAENLCASSALWPFSGATSWRLGSIAVRDGGRQCVTGLSLALAPKLCLRRPFITEATLALLRADEFLKAFLPTRAVHELLKFHVPRAQ